MIRLSQTFKFICSPHIPLLTHKVTILSPQNIGLGGNCFEYDLGLTFHHLLAHFHMYTIQIDQSPTLDHL